MNAEHHGELELRRFRIGELPPERSREIADHVPGCDACQARLAAIDAEAARFRESISFERFAAGVASAGRTARRRPRIPRWVPPAMALAAAAGVVLALSVRPATVTGPAPAGANRVKGGGAAVDFYVGGEGTPRLAGAAERLAAGERVRIGYHPGPYRYLAVVSVDDGGEVSRLYPTGGESLPVTRGRGAETLLPSSVAFSGHGPERVVVVLTRRPVPVSRVARKVKAAWRAAGGDVTHLGPLDLPGAHFHRVFLKP